MDFLVVSPLHYKSIEYPRNNSKLNKSGHQLQEQNWLRIHLFFPRQPDWSIALFEEAVLSSDHLPWLFNESRAFYWLWKPAKHGGRLAGVVLDLKQLRREICSKSADLFCYRPPTGSNLNPPFIVMDIYLANSAFELLCTHCNCNCKNAYSAIRK